MYPQEKKHSTQYDASHLCPLSVFYYLYLRGIT